MAEKQILFIDACARKESRTRRLTESVLSHIEGRVTHLKLYEKEMFPLDENAINQRDECVACGSCEPDHLSFAKQFAAADEILIAAPYWDFSFPSLLKVYLENVTVNGITFTYTEAGIPKGLCKAGRLLYVTTAGGPITDASFGYGYVQALCSNLYGIADTEYLCAENLDIIGMDPDAILREAEAEAARRFGTGKVYNHPELSITECSREEKSRGIIVLNPVEQSSTSDT
ncbi:MAG: NAD(P)H-dependent oxidoreductase [Eubacterium sp.]|nr:NAD(P)H-dependent oxidoreductase [Eubacterium sp.]